MSSAIAYQCPECRSRLAAKPLARGNVWACGACAGVCATVALLRQHAAEPIVQRLWAGARDRGRIAERLCPSCSQPLRAFELDADDDRIELDGCVRCLVLWFDGRELERIGVQLPEPSIRSDELVRAQALMDTQLLEEAAQYKRAAEVARVLMYQIYWHWLRLW
jgi:Zn-finger nucleic acid-binding protein